MKDFIMCKIIAVLNAKECKQQLNHEKGGKRY